MQAEAWGSVRNLEGLYAGHYKIVWTTHKPHLIFSHQHINISEMLQKFNYKINKRGNSGHFSSPGPPNQFFPFLWQTIPLLLSRYHYQHLVP